MLHTWRIIYFILAAFIPTYVHNMMCLCINIPVGDGISIPCSYTSHVVPISAPKLHADLSNTDAKLKVFML